MSKSQHAQRGKARTNRPERSQVEMRFLSLDQWLDEDHLVRTVWQYVESLDLSELYGQIQAVQGTVGRNAIDPRILFALWLFATIEGISSARRVADLTKRDIPYMWICGGVSVNHHRLSDFRVQHGELLEGVMIDSIAALMNQNLVTLQTVAQDGMRVRADAGTSSFRRKGSLEEALQHAEAHVQKLKEDHDDDPSGGDRRQDSARQRAAEEKVTRIKHAKEEMDKLHQQRAERRGSPTSEPRVSTTDPEARRMKMGDGGFRPALNVQFVSDGDQRLIVGVDVTNQGTDNGLMGPMHDRLQKDYGVTPENYLVDGGFTKESDVTQVERCGTQVIAPLHREQSQLAAGKDPYDRKRGDSDEMAEFRHRMGTPEAKEFYKRRSSIAEFPNADCRNRGLHQFCVRGLIKAKAQVLWHALAFNFRRMLNLEILDKLMTN
jgi:transposase